jgi:hypothetical protein
MTTEFVLPKGLKDYYDYLKTGRKSAPPPCILNAAEKVLRPTDGTPGFDTSSPEFQKFIKDYLRQPNQK